MSILQTIELESSSVVIVTLEVLVEEMPLLYDIVKSGDAEADQALEDAVISEWDHNNFSWCCFRVVATLRDYPAIYGDDCMGGISILEKYLAPGTTLESEAIIMVKDHDMIANAKNNLHRAIALVEKSILDFQESA